MPVYRDEKTKKYYAKFYYKDWRGQRHQKLKRGFSRSQEAKKYERDFLNELTQGSLITFEHLCQHYLSDNEGRLKPTTQYTSKNIIRNWLLPVFSDMPINQITPLMIRKWQTELMQHSNLAPTYQLRCQILQLAGKPCTQGRNYRQQPFTALVLLDA